MIKKYIFTIVFALIVVSAAISVASVIFRLDESKRIKKTMEDYAVNQRFEDVFAAINDFPGSAGKDILLLYNLSSVQNFHKTASRAISPELKSDFTNFLTNNDIYKDLFFYRKNFNCVIRVSKNSEYSKDECENPSPFVGDLLERSSPLAMGEVYISPIVSYADISMQESDRNIPVIMYITPANTDCSVISVIDANYFLEEIRRLARKEEQVFLLDGDGFYLANTDRSKENISLSAKNFYKDFPEVDKSSLSDASLRLFETETKRFTFWRIYPTESNFAIYEGANKILGKESQNRYFWIMAAVSDKPKIGLWYGNLSYIVAVAAILIAHLSVAGLVYIMNLKNRILCSSSKQ